MVYRNFIGFYGDNFIRFYGDFTRFLGFCSRLYRLSKITKKRWLYSWFSSDFTGFLGFCSGFFY